MMSGGAREKEQHCARDVDSGHTHTTGSAAGWMVGIRGGSGANQGLQAGYTDGEKGLWVGRLGRWKRVRGVGGGRVSWGCFG